MRWQRAAVVGGALAALVGTILMGCTDGVTPDCSDAATQCGPDVDGSVSNEGAIFPEASKPDTGTDGTTDALSDAPDDNDSALDGGDGG